MVNRVFGEVSSIHLFIFISPYSRDFICFTRNTNKMQLCNRIYYSKVYWRLNMFRAAHRSSSGALNFVCSLWFIYPCGDRPLPRLSGKAASCWYFYWIIHDARIHGYHIHLFLYVATARSGRGPYNRGFTITHTHTHTHTPHSVGLLWMSDQPCAETSLCDNRQHPQETDSHVPGGIRTRNPSKRANVYPRLRPRIHWDRLEILFQLSQSEVSAFWVTVSLLISQSQELRFYVTIHRT